MTARILIIIPAYNEGSSLALAIGDVRQHNPQCDILVVNDGSSDNTQEVAESLGVHLINHPVKSGIGSAVQRGLRWAVKGGYDIAVQFDGDGQHQAKYITSLIDPILKGGCDLIIGSRFIAKNPSLFKTTFSRRCGMVFFAFVYRLLTGNRISDTTSGFRAYGKDLMNFFSENYPADFPDMPALLVAYRKGFQIKEIPVKMNQREHGSSSTNLWKSLWYPFKTLAHTLAVYRDHSTNQ